MPPPSPSRSIDDPAAALRRAEHLATEARFLDAVDVLTEANRHQRDDEIERRLVALRHAAFGELDLSQPGWPWIDEPARPRNGDDLPSIDRDDLTAETVRDSILRYGCASVRGLLSAPDVAALRAAIDNAFAAYDAHQGGAPLDGLSPWWRPFPAAGGLDLAGTRLWVREGGGVWTGESPPALFDFLEIMERAGVRSLVTSYLGERPALTLGKSTLRRVRVDSGGDWHQDGAFLGTGIRTINLWLTLSDCGVDAPGLELVPRRLDELAPTGTFGTWFDWAVSPDMAEQAAGDVPFLWPEFQAGDALLFDELFLHRTAVSPAMTKDRHAIETWFFAPSVYPGDQVPIVW